MGGLVRTLLPKPAQPYSVPVLKTLPEGTGTKQAEDNADTMPEPRPKRKGRAATILTSEAGVPGEAFVGRKLLLGQ